MNNRTNMYPGKCILCGATVDAEMGVLTPERKVMHNPGSCRPAAGAAMVTPRVDDSTMEGAVDKVITLMGHKMAELVPELVEQNLDRLSRVAEIKIGKLPSVKVGVAHRSLPDILMAVVAGTSPFLVGPAGSGKTTLASQIADVLKRKFYMEARVTSEFKMLGFIDAHGHTVRTQFREAYEHGGVFLFDEVDASDPDALTAFNAALANGQCAFPDALINVHKDFVAIAAGNTFGRGADRQYVGRNQLDAATLDRFAVFEIDYDEALERQLCGDAEWCKRVQRVRRAIDEEKVRHIVSPRASLAGAKLLAAGMARDKVEEAVIWKGLDESNRSRVQARLGEKG